MVTPIAAESWPSNKASRATFEALVRPLEDAVRRGCDAVFLDLHGAMVVEDADDAEGEILRRVRAIAPRVPIAVTSTTTRTCRRRRSRTPRSSPATRPIRTSTCTRRAGSPARSSARTLRGEVEPVIAWGWLPLVPSIMRHAPEDGPSGDIVALAREAERDGRVLAATLLPAFAHADTPFTGCSAVVMGDARRGGKAAAQAVCDAMLKIAWDRREEYVFRAPPLAESVARAHELGKHNPAGPVLLIDHCDNCGSGGAQDVMKVVAEILRQDLDDVAIAPIRDPPAVAKMVEAGVGANVTLALGGQTDMPSIGLKGKPLEIAGRVAAITDGEVVFTGPMYTGVKSHLGRTAVLDTGRARIVVTERHHEPFDLVRVPPLRDRADAGALHHAQVAHPLPRRLQADRLAHRRVPGGGRHQRRSVGLPRTEKLKRPIYPLDPM